MVNGTASIHLALKIAGVHSGHEVIAPTLTFIAPINAISYLGAKPVFMDSDSVFNIDTEKTIDKWIASVFRQACRFLGREEVGRRRGGEGGALLGCGLPEVGE